MGRLGALTVALILGVSSCTPVADHDPDASWAEDAEAVVTLLEDAYETSDPYQIARFFTAGGTLDLSVWALGVGTTPDEIVRMIQDLYAPVPAGTDVDARHVFLSLDGAVVWWYSHGDAVTRDWIQTYAFGDDGGTASRAFRSLDVPHRPAALEEHTVLKVAERYVAAWNGQDRTAFDEVYTAGAVVTDDLRHVTLRGLEEITHNAIEESTMEPGPWPGIFTYRSGAHIEAIVLLQMNGPCPMLEARRWSLNGERIAFESRYVHVPSARRCLTDLDEGWWSNFQLGPALDENVTGIIDAGGRRLDLVNATVGQREFASWMMNRFERAGLGVPEVKAIWFPPSPDCEGRAGLTFETDERYDGSHTVVLCASDDRMRLDETASGWAPSVLATGLHELAHVWMLDHLDDQTRGRFLDRTDLTVWRGSGETAWRERGVEHAAFTIAWGLAGTGDARYPLLPPPACEELAGRFELLTGRSPITRCVEGAE